MIDVFSGSFLDTARERAGFLLAKKDHQKDRGSKKKTDEEIFQDFEHNLYHPFMSVLMKDAMEHVASQKPFVVHKRITILTSDENSDAFFLYYNEGDTWRASGNALIGKYLKEYFHDLQMPGMKLGVKGLQQMLDAYPGHFDDIREELKIRAAIGDEEDEEEEENEDERDPLEETD